MSVSSVKEPRKNKNKNERKVEGERHWQFSLLATFRQKSSKILVHSTLCRML